MSLISFLFTEAEVLLYYTVPGRSKRTNHMNGEFESYSESKYNKLQKLKSHLQQNLSIGGKGTR